MNATEKYNGWTNYETWSVNLLITNDEGGDTYWREVAEEVWEAAEADDLLTKSENARYTLADRLKDEHETAKDEMLEAAGQTCSLWHQLLDASLSEVDWSELADTMLSDEDGYERRS